MAGVADAAGLQGGIVMTGKGRMNITGVTFRENNNSGLMVTNVTSGVYSTVTGCQFYDNGSGSIGGSA